MDSSCRLYQLAHLSTWFRCIAVALPGYGRWPRAEPGLTVEDLATACWESVDAVGRASRRSSWAARSGRRSRNMRAPERIPSAELEVIPGAGHACHLEQPWVFDRLLLDFLWRHDLVPDGGALRGAGGRPNRDGD